MSAVTQKLLTTSSVVICDSVNSLFWKSYKVLQKTNIFCKSADIKES